MPRKPAGAPSPISNTAFAPELCRTEKTAPSGDDWLHEVKWDGYRILATVVDGKVRLWSRNAKEWTEKIPAIAADIAALKLHSAQLDGELVAVSDGKVDFNALHADRAGAALAYVLFDMPYFDGLSLRNEPLVERKELLQRVLKKAKKGSSLRYSEHVVGKGPAVFASAAEHELEGIVSKRVNGRYTGTRSGAWVKVKARPSDEFVVVGFTEPQGSRSGIGALLLAEFDGAGRLIYIGRVGTGFSDRQLVDLRKSLEKDRVSSPTADDNLMEKKDRALALWVKPRLIIEVFHQGRGGNGLLRQPAFKTFRADKSLKSLKT
ncbi:MAG: non-homologous end-joining DNA ligase [Dokdonella sp.]|uniref:non-homologous end-joining DNA ligase n=1 Tax=Dokdonella sp. TaxID=2291710 RepID=UPI003F7D388B